MWDATENNDEVLNILCRLQFSGQNRTDNLGELTFDSSKRSRQTLRTFILAKLFLPVVTAAVALTLFPGCRETQDQITPEIPRREPTSADLPDRHAIERFEARHRAGNPNTNEAWPQLFGPDRTSTLHDVAIEAKWPQSGPPERWSIAVGTGYGSPVTAGDQVVFNHRIDDHEIVQCVSIDQGSTHWLHRYPTTFECQFDYSDGPYSTPVIVADRVYTVGGQGQFLCLSLDDGQVIWQRDLHAEYELDDGDFPVGASPGIDQDRIVFNLGAGDADAGVVCLDRQTGETLWEASAHGRAYCSPMFATIAGSKFVFVTTDLGLLSLHPATGEIDWEFEHRSRTPMSYNAVSPLVHEDKVLLVTGPGPGAVCLKVNADRSYEVLWEDRRALDCQFNTLMLAGDDVFGFTAAGQGGAEFRCVDFDTGEVQWRYHSLLRRGQGLIAGDAIVLFGERGHLASLLLDSQAPQVLSFSEMPVMQEPCYCSPALSRGMLLLKNEQRLVCFDVMPGDVMPGGPASEELTSLADE